jgi:AcrR family transcriptional regulator
MAMSAAVGGLARRPGTRDHRERTLSVAATVLTERGFERTRLRDVAEAAGVSIGLLQNYFATRDAMVEEAFSFTCAELIARWREHAAQASDPWEKIVGLVDELLDDPEPRRHSATWTEFCASASRHPQLVEPVARVYETWHRILLDAVDEGIATGRFRPSMPAPDVADSISATIDGLQMALAVGGGVMEETRFRRLAIAVTERLVGR